jgi:lipopolysaccharide export system permease protein
MIGITIGMGFNIVDKIVNHMGLIYNLNPPLMALLPSLTIFAAVLFAMKKAKT